MNLTLNIELTTREVSCIKYFNNQTLTRWGIIPILIDENNDPIRINDFDQKELQSLCDKGILRLIEYNNYKYFLNLSELGIQCYEKLKNEM